MDGARIKKEEFRWKCSTCRTSSEPGWLWLGAGDWVQCPHCTGGYINGIQTRIEPTRKIFIPKVV